MRRGLCAVRRPGFVLDYANREENQSGSQGITAVGSSRKLKQVIPFWVDRLGFTKTIDVPDGNRLASSHSKKGATPK